MSKETEKIKLYYIKDLEELLDLEVHDVFLEYSNNFEKIDYFEPYSGNSIPDSGNWNYLDKIWNTDIEEGDYIGWVCLRSGKAAPKWESGNDYEVDDLILPNEDNGHYYICLSGGTSGIKEPTFPTSDEETVRDIRDYFTWNSNTEYDENDIVLPSDGENGYYYLCTQNGTSGDSEPDWIEEEGEVIEDNTIEWTAYKIVVWEEKGTSCKFKRFGKIED